MYQVIARKYRPQSFADVVNQEHVKTTLENAIAQNRIAHGYIFSGQRGTGKTIEEPPAWAVFMLCTTEAHKIPATIASRCQHFSFRSVEFEALVARIAWICGQEGIHADAEALSVLAQAGEGSVRDSLSALDQAIACCGDTLQAAEVRALLGAFSLDALGHVSQALVDGAAARMLEVVNE